MIGVDISNIWGAVSLPDLLAMESEVTAAHEAVVAGMDADQLSTRICNACLLEDRYSSRKR